MKRNGVMVIVLGCLCFLLLATTKAGAEDAVTTATRVTSELQQAGVVTQSEAAAIQAPLKDMAETGASKEELKSVVTDLTDKGAKGDDLKQWEKNPSQKAQGRAREGDR